MSKTIKNCFYDKIIFTKLLQAHKRASENKRNKKEIILFEVDLETNIIQIMNELKNGTYKFGNYREFIVYEPKERVIRSLPYRDRVVHQWYIEEFIKPYFCIRFISDTYACLNEKGTHKAVYKTQKYMRAMKSVYGNYFVLKCDIKKYFYTIDKKILMNILKKKIADKKLLEFTEVILNDGEEKGIPIGNYTSQYFANIYLNELDHFVKEQLRIKYYIRYMDDFIFLLPTKEAAKNVLQDVRIFLLEHLNLELNKKSKYFPNKFGIDFCGFKIYETHILLRKRFKKKLNKSIKIWYHLKEYQKFNYKKYLLCINSYRGHASHSNSYNYMQKIDNIIEELNK